MGTVKVKGEVKQAEIRAVVIRKDGSREDLGVVSYYHRSWWRRALWKIRSKAKETFKW